MSRTVAPPPTDRSMWRHALARAHPDSGGDGPLFVWLSSVRDFVLAHEPGDRHRGDQDGAEVAPRVPFDADLDFPALTGRALRLATETGEPYAGLLRLLADCAPADHGRPELQQRRGATYKTLAAIAHGVGMSKPQRVEWYRICEGIPLSQRHASHLLATLKERAAA